MFAMVNTTYSCVYVCICFVFQIRDELTMTRFRPINLTSLAVALTVFVSTSLTPIKAELLPKIPDHIECDETPPDCEPDHHRVEGLRGSFTIPDHGLVDSIGHSFSISTNKSLCSLDPMGFVTNITNNRSASIEIQFKIECPSGRHTRVIIRPSRDLTSPLIFAYLDIINCTVYWKDLSTFGRHVDIRALNLFAWTDEFGEHQPDYFRQCVELDDLQGQVGDIEPPISGLANIGTIVVSSFPLVFTHMAFSPVFNRHLWPLMVEVVFHG